MITGHTAAQIRTAERPLIDAGVPLMARAARALAGEALTLLHENAGAVAGRRVLLLVGPGSNGGDALWAGAHLRRRGAAVRAITTADTWHVEGATALRAAGGRMTPLSELFTRGDESPEAHAELSADLVIDGILGTAGRPEHPPRVAALLDAIADAGLPVLAVDVPSGMDATTGAHDPHTLAATATLAIGSVSQGLLLPAAEDLAGRIIPLDIGIGVNVPAPAIQRLTDADVAALWPHAPRDGTKYTRGVAGIIAGSTDFPGAAVLAAEAACRIGAGMVRVLAPESVLAHVMARRPEIVGAEGRVQALCIGPGVPGDDARLEDGIDQLLDGTPGVIDAGGIDALANSWDGLPQLGEHVILTPHRGEAERLARTVLTEADDPGAMSAWELVRALAHESGATVLLKGPVTLVASGKRLFSQADAVPQLATAGAGDVLAGTITALLAQGVDAAEAAAAGALIHGRAARLASAGGVLPITALQVAEHLPQALASILGAARPSAGPRPAREEGGGADERGDTR